MLRGVNFTNLKTPSDYITKSKLKELCLQLTQTPGSDYIIWLLFLWFGLVDDIKSVNMGAGHNW